ncbi:NAD(P)-binding domain-containing protein [Alteromonas sp. 5E99-2]|uniref:NAD(P)/FAD-dependent oxidoreductase n=1 Tax=Alteromonas sp. 5E99-2 TaxID=2817683 RepID=UPI001A99C93D|nr:NAD(P)/FAD-dependent oxidoreductase [Alteromonas sp. 5E99-2]MBO1255276.1 NAD(P)-binding domain-containing protein [Alteromonas sp. 5E99-2]
MVTSRQDTKVTVIGAGPAGLGCAALLKQMGIKDADMVILDASTVGSSFKAWPKEMKLITPSFPSNGYHQTDLNAITPDTSPGFSVGKEHLSGDEYAGYLNSVASHYEIKVLENTQVIQVEPQPYDHFLLTTNTGKRIYSQYVIWAGGEYSSPRMSAFEGSHLCVHNSEITSWKECEEDHYVVIGGYESGVDAAYNLASLGKKVTLIDNGGEQESTYDPSKVLSPYTAERLSAMANSHLVELEQNFSVKQVLSSADGFRLVSTNGKAVVSKGIPINCTGFDTHLGPVHELFKYENGLPLVNNFDESICQNNLFLAGPKLAHDTVLLCFIYKFRGRFALPCKVIGTELDLDMSILSHYKQAGMLLDDLGCCVTQECFC